MNEESSRLTEPSTWSGLGVIGSVALLIAQQYGVSHEVSGALLGGLASVAGGMSIYLRERHGGAPAQSQMSPRPVDTVDALTRIAQSLGAIQSRLAAIEQERKP